MRVRAAASALAVSLAVAAGVASAGPHAVRAPKVTTPPTFVVTGRGWGHGVGMSQCGALGYAKHGRRYREILASYYPGTVLARTPVSRVRVLLADGRRSLAVSSRKAFTVRDGKGTSYPLAAGRYELTTALTLKVGEKKKPKRLPGPLTFVPGGASLALEKPYRGQIVVEVTGGALRAVNSVPLEQYLYGVVPLEIGTAGPADALKAQAVAARSYALAERRSGDFDLYPDTRSQVYGGVGAEERSTSTAVDQTVGEVLTYRGKVIAAYYSASSGGRTAAVQDAWPGSRPIPYLVSVPDPYDSVCSVHRWGPYAFSSTELAAKLRVRARLVDARVVVNPSQRVSALVVDSSAGRASIAGTTVRRLLALRSTWFRVGVLSLSRPAAPAVSGSEVELTGLARGVAGIGAVTVEQRPLGARWTRLARVRPGQQGAFALRVAPKRTTDYRVVAGNFASQAVRVSVVPKAPSGP